MDGTEILTVQQVMDILKVSNTTVYAMCDREELKWFPVGNGKQRKNRRILAKSVQDFIERESHAIIPMPSEGPLNADGFSELRSFGYKG